MSLRVTNSGKVRPFTWKYNATTHTLQWADGQMPWHLY